MPPRTGSLFHMAGRYSPCHTCKSDLDPNVWFYKDKTRQVIYEFLSLNLMSVIHSLGYSRKICKTVWNLASYPLEISAEISIRSKIHGNSAWFFQEYQWKFLFSSFLIDPLNFHIIYDLSSVPLECPQPQPPWIISVS